MKKFITTAAVVSLLATAAQAADQKSTDPKTGMMQGDMMNNCQSHMKDGKMMDNMPKDMMGQCQEMMKDGGMMQGGMKDMKPTDATKSDTTKAADDADHAKHHPAQ